jgi:twinkle protein
VDGILSIEANAKLHIEQEREMFSKDDLNVLYDKVFMGKNKDRVWIHSHLGLHNIDELFSKLRFMIVGCGCKWIILDHLHMLVLSMVDGDERQGIDHIMGRLRELVEETHAGLILVSHLRRVDGNRGHENGIETSLSHLRGSQSIAQVSDTVCSIERDQQADCPITANTSKIRVLKCRYSGDVGLATSLLYDKVTGRLSEVEMDTDELTGETL